MSVGMDGETFPRFGVGGAHREPIRFVARSQCVAQRDEEGLGAALRALRLSRGLSLADAAARGGTSKAALGAWEIETRQPRGPALARLLEALGADDRTKARLLDLADPEHARLALAGSPFGSHVDVGMVLRAMRERRGLAQADLAGRLGVSQAAVSKWELGEAAPSVETVHALGFALGALAEETLALASAAGRGGGGLPQSPEAALAAMGAHAVPYALREAALLGWEAELGRRAARDARWDPFLALALAQRAAWLSEEQRYAEIDPIARRAIALAATPEARFLATPAVAALADADRGLRRGHAAAAALAGEWAARLPESQNRAWMLRQRGMSLVRMGRTSEGLGLVEQSAEMDLRTGDGLDPWAYVAATVCEAYLEAGDPRAADALLGGRREEGFEAATFVRVGHAVGRAATEAEMAYLRHRTAHEAPSPLKRRRHAEIERRQAHLTGERPPAAHPVPRDPETEADLWAAVLREAGG
ncbi:XRE family transcriptional regulator [bacterium]|nr:MAG: XRE family transcriptional regulator [bacterium]